MIKKNAHHPPEGVSRDVVDLKGLSRTRATPVPTMLPQRRLGYPAQAPTRVFAAHALVHTETDTQYSRKGKNIFFRIVAAILMPLMLVQPMSRAYAAEVEGEVAAPSTLSESETETAPDAVTETEAPPAESPPTPTPPISEGAPLPAEGGPLEGSVDASATTTSDVTSSTEDTPAPEAPPEDSDSGGGGSFGGGSSDATGTSTSETEDATTTSSDIATSLPEQVEEEATSTLPVDPDVLDENAPALDEESPVMEKSAEEIAADEALRTERLRTQLRREVEEEFLRGCISFETSGYYCLNDGARKPTATTTEKVVTTVESQQGVGGDKEIFVVRNGARTPLTSNDFDDAFPSGDASGEQFVWQGMKGGRWQIFFGTLNASGTQSVTQLTDSRESNFNPKIDGEHIVWQGWADENWEIFIATKRDAHSPLAGEHLPEGNMLLNVSNEWAVERLTTNSAHDMFPSLHGDIVTWQSRVGADWVVNAYSITQKRVTQLSASGAKGENPRFALTWEERDQEGNARLVGYDIATGEKTDITSASLRLPSSPYKRNDTTPQAQSDPVALPPPTTVGSSTSRGSDDDTGDNPLLP